MKSDADKLKDLKLENEMLITTVHELYDLVKDLRSENKDLKQQLEIIEDV